MRVKSAINTIRAATTVSAVLVLVSVVFYFKGWQDVIFLIVYLVLILISIFITLGKKQWARYLFRRTKYPGILYGVCDALGYLRNIDTNPSKEILDDLYQPSYPTVDFLRDNGLTAEAYPVSPAMKMLGVVLIYGMPGLTLLLLKAISVPHNYYILFGVAILFGVLLNDHIKKNRDTGANPFFIFKPDGLYMIDDIILSWDNIHDWEYVVARRGRRNVVRIDIHTVRSVNGQRTFAIELEDMIYDRIDLYMLLTHYKYKYGYCAGN